MLTNPTALFIQVSAIKFQLEILGDFLSILQLYFVQRHITLRFPSGPIVPTTYVAVCQAPFAFTSLTNNETHIHHHPIRNDGISLDGPKGLLTTLVFHNVDASITESSLLETL
jgi:hypothetical protein